MQNSQEMLEKGSYKRLILRLSIPTVVIMLVMVLYNMADTFFIGQTGDPNKLAAVSLCAPVFSVLSGLGTLFGSGGCTAISLALGKGEPERVRAYSSLCCWGTLAIGLVFGAITLAAAEPLARLLGADDAMRSDACTYLRILGLGAPLILFGNVFTNFIRADGSAVQSLAANGLGTVTNIALDALFILVLGWDVAGAALATVLGNAAGCAYLLIYLRRKRDVLSLRPKDMQLCRDTVLPVFTLGLPLACGTLLMSVSSMLANHLTMRYGAVALAAQGIAGKVGMLISMLAMGICMGFQPAISYCCGRGNLQRMRRLIRNTGIYVTAVGIFLTVVCFFARDTILSAFIDSPEVAACGRVMIFASLLIGPVYGLYQLCQTFLQSTGRAGAATVVSVLDKGLIFLPVLYGMERIFGLYGISFASCVTLALSLIIAGVLSLRWNRVLGVRQANRDADAAQSA